MDISNVELSKTKTATTVRRVSKMLTKQEEKAIIKKIKIEQSLMKSFQSKIDKVDERIEKIAEDKVAYQAKVDECKAEIEKLQSKLPEQQEEMSFENQGSEIDAPEEEEVSV